MELLIPLLIVVVGIIYSAFKGNNENRNTGPRNIDKGKLNNPNRQRPSGQRPTTQRSSNREPEQRRGIFGELVGELEKGFKEFQDEMEKSQSQNSDKGMLERRRAQVQDAQQTSRRVAQDTYKRSRERVEREADTIRDVIDSRGGSISDSIDMSDVQSGRPNRQQSERRTVDRQSRNDKVAARAEILREKNRTNRVQSSIERVGRTERTDTRQTAEANRYSMDSDFIRTGEIGSYEFRVDRKTVLDGIIFSEILHKPKSKQK